MANDKDLSLEELSNIFCMETDELKDFLESRDFNLDFNHTGELRFPLEEVQKHLQSQYFI